MHPLNKTPSTKDTSSSSIDYTPKSPTLSSSPSTNGYLNPPLSPPPRVPPPPPTQAPNSMEITLSLSPITPLLKAQLQAKDTTICKFKEHINTMRENDKEEKVKHEMDEIETINIELEHSVAKLLSENERLHKEIEHLKKIYKDQFDSIKETCALSKEHDDSLIAQLNNKSMENADLKFQIQDKVFMITSLKNDLRKLKGKEVENASQIPISTTVAPGMFKIDLDPLAPRLLQNREAHIYYLKHTQEQADILQGIVE
ncbi:hypothetical protein Tco_1066383 [Tanacetum coccineum]|uniref:Uncharacterized protein n=1 Tax=Tanacetum coccineum TaxID=301880 RepID=A0ABQ5H9W1_9ASTR